MSQPKVSVILSYIRSERTIGRCLEALRSQDYPDYEIIAVNAKDYGNCSEAKGQNIALSKATGEIIAFTNSDIYVPKDWLSRSVSILQSGYDIAAGNPFWMGDEFAMAWNPPFRRHWDERLGFGFSSGSCWRKWVKDGVPETGSFHDGVWFWQATQAGAKPFIDRTLVVDHDHRFKSLTDSFRRAYMYEFGLAIILRLLYPKGSSSPISAGSMKNQLREVLMIDGIRAWQDWGLKGRVSLPRFLWLRTLGFKLPSVIGLLRAASIKSPSWSDVPDTHSNARRGIG